MDHSIDILNELNAISPIIAGMEKVNVFTVPAGYFESLEADILMAVKDEGAMLSNIPALPLNDVPRGYFDSLADNILNKIKGMDDVEEELKELSPFLHNLPQQNVFTVPDGYFESFASTVLSKVNRVENTDEELSVLSPRLLTVKNKNVFAVPDGYFDSLPGIILNAVTPQQAKVVTMRKRTVTTFIKYAVAAIFTGAMALGLYQFTGNRATTKTALPGYVVDGQKIKNVDEEIAKVSDDDIIKYLQANGENIDAQAVATNMVNENELPSQEDYLTDDKALDKYLDNIDLNDLKN